MTRTDQNVRTYYGTVHHAADNGLPVCGATSKTTPVRTGAPISCAKCARAVAS